MLSTYIAVAWLTSCSPAGWVDQFQGFMTLDEAKRSLGVRQCETLSPSGGMRGLPPHDFCVQNESDKIGYVAIRYEKSGPRVEMGPGVKPCSVPVS